MLHRSLILLLALVGLLPAQDANLEAGLDAGGPLSAEQAAYDVRRYELDLRVFPETRRIAGRVTVRFDAVSALPRLVLDLHGALEVTAVEDGKGQSLEFTHRDAKLRIELGQALAAGESGVVEVAYRGSPRVAPRAPWDGGFTFKRTPSGDHWIATSCQTNGADLWWPCKDHPSDEPDSVGIAVTVPAPLFCASNGKHLRTEELQGDLRRCVWEVSTPINAYNVALNIAPYVRIDRKHKSVAGDEFPVVFYALPSNAKRAAKFVDEIVLRDLAWFEKTFGPYPFRGDKYGVAETPYLGMEHQTIIAYGNDYKVIDGYDWLHHHELSHEWWGNLVSVADWQDFWIHEGIGTWCQALFLRDLRGPEAYRKEMRKFRFSLANRAPVAPRDLAGARQVYMAGGGNDIYYKGAWIMHTLSWLIGWDEVHAGLRLFLYPDAKARASIDGSACRSVTTEELQAVMEKVGKQKLDWFFELYLRQPELPVLETTREGQNLTLRWKTPNDLPFPMPVPVEIGGKMRRVAMPEGRAELTLAEGEEAKIDPDRWLLRRIGRRR